MIRDNSRRPRIALYSHDTMGLGHVRRNLLLGRTLAASPSEPNVLLLSGAIDTKSLYMPPGVDCVTLPSLYKGQDGKYRSRRLRMDLAELIGMRGRMLNTSIAAFDPDLLVVDTAPWGVAGELKETLRALSAKGRTRLVLGMRDVWDDPSAIQSEWRASNNWEPLKRYYDQVWVYGDPSVYDPVSEYSISGDIAQKIRYTGYLGRTRQSLVPTTNYAENQPELHTTPFVLCIMGGGQDGVHLADAFLDADLPSGRNGLIVTGPYMDPDEIQRLRRKSMGAGRARIIDFVPEPLFFVIGAESIVSMGGYNAVCEILSYRKRALIVPRTEPRKEQMIRAMRLRDCGLVEVLLPDQLTSDGISEFLRRPHQRAPSVKGIDLGGLAKFSKLAESIIGSGKDATANTASEETAGQRV